MFLKGSKSSKAANGSGLDGVMAGVLAANEAMPNGSDEDELNGLLKGLLLFSGIGEVFFIICSLGGRAGGGAN